MFQKRHLRRWQRLQDVARTTDLENLRQLQGHARAVAQRAASVSLIAETRLLQPLIGANKMDVPPSTNWAHRPDLWAGPIDPVGYAPARNNSRIGKEVTLYHDCKSGSVSARQVRNSGPHDAAPFGLQMDIFDFNGSFLSLVIQAPDHIIQNLKKTQILRLAMTGQSERPLEISTRLNLKNGPNTEQVSREVSLTPDGSAVEFDLAYVPFQEAKAERVWFDLFFDAPAMNQVQIRDLTLSRHPRAEV